MKVAYLSNSFPEPTETYVAAEMQELRTRSVNVLACSVRRPKQAGKSAIPLPAETTYILPIRLATAVAASWLLMSRFAIVHDIVSRAVRGPESISRRMRCLVHTWLGAYLAVLLRKSPPPHIHVHHGYFASWVGMVAARFLHVGFSLTLHGSDLLVRADYLDVKLHNCKFCFTISEFNREYILDRYPQIDARKILVQHLGINPALWKPRISEKRDDDLHILSVGRLHPVKNHGFLLLACRTLKSAGVRFRCVIAGEGEERPVLEKLIADLDLRRQVELLGHVPRAALPKLYASADAVVFTSHSEGIPLALMEAMAMERAVLAPEITGIPELVVHGRTGYLYRQGSMEDFLTQLQLLQHHSIRLDAVRRNARRHVLSKFNEQTNLERFTAAFLLHTEAPPYSQALSFATHAHENPLLQQI